MTYKLVVMAVLLALLVGGSFASNKTEVNNYNPVIPSIFVVLRHGASSSDLGDWAELINAALPEDKRSRELKKMHPWENVIIIDEGSSWAVVFALRGNGMISSKEGGIGLSYWNDSVQDGEGTIVYLEKGTLKRLNIPDKGLARAPYIAPPELNARGDDAADSSQLIPSIY